ncbi:Longitudinals lacking protein, isoforms N/O/W/X/Y [Trachymyrmex septentrionalis]|uniref:Longitudinals lacking protein, isoforms N/O/W/X/Y n=1 Tax=Trachymyrmex septentrionalis TaxID=34720 RepID=A0A195EUY0_9HYME|nr:Longitudinals lacking protein, isoforms N/O/W/X/Y [Trachymyrmex septentrionalis]
MTMAAIVTNLRMTLIRLMVISVGMRDIIAGVIVITIMIRIKPSPSVVTAAAENISGKHPYIAIKEMNAERNRSTSAFIAITGRKYDRIGFVMRKLTQNLDANANRLKECGKPVSHHSLDAGKLFKQFVRFKHRIVVAVSCTKQYKCDKCNKVYKNKGSLKRHTKDECGILPRFNCPICEYRCKQKSNLLRHINNVHGRTKQRSRNALPHKRYNCHKCGIKSYVNKSTLNRHLREECNMEPQNSCPYCNKRIHQRCNFQRHMKKVHHNVYIIVLNVMLSMMSIKVLLHNSQIAKQISDPVLESFFKQNCTMSIKNKFHAFILELTLELTSQTKCCALYILFQVIFIHEYSPFFFSEQTPLEILLDANIPVLCESINVSTAGSNVLSTDSVIWKKLQEMFEKETAKINIKLDSLSVKVGSLVENMKVVKNKIQLNQCEHLRRYVDYSTTLSKNITSMIKMVITRNVAIEYTASKVTPGKALMKDEHLYACIEDILLQNEFQGEIVTTKLLLKALSTSLSNAKDWDGHRKDRDGQRKDRDM